MLLISRCSLMHNHLAVQWIAHNHLPLLDYRRRCCELGRLEDFIISQISDHLFVGDHFVPTALCVPGPRPGMHVYQKHVQRDRWTLDVVQIQIQTISIWSLEWWMVEHSDFRPFFFAFNFLFYRSFAPTFLKRL